MADYIYKVTGKVKTLKDGTRANVAVFAFKDWMNKERPEGLKMYNKVYRATGCHNADRYVKNGKTFTGRIIFEGMDDPELALKWSQGTISDYAYDMRLQCGLTIEKS